MKYLIFIIALLGCHHGFHVQRTKTKQEQLPESCKGIVELINSDWLKKRRVDCRFDNGIYKRLETEYGSCLMKLGKSQLISLLGEPDMSQNQFFYYFFDENCTNKSRISQKYLRIGFDKDEMVHFVETGLRTTGGH